MCFCVCGSVEWRGTLWIACLSVRDQGDVYYYDWQSNSERLEAHCSASTAKLVFLIILSRTPTVRTADLVTAKQRPREGESPYDDDGWQRTGVGGVVGE